MIITNSPDITLLKVQVTWDISGTLPIIRLVNQSTGANLAGVNYAFTAKSPSGTYIHNGNISSPDVEGVWSTFTLNNAFPRPFNQIEWSGNSYSFFVTAKDSNGNVYTNEPQVAFICRPQGNLPNAKNTFGLASSDVKIKCEQGRVFFQDTTDHSYKGLSGTLVSSSLRVVYPIDETATIPNPFILADYSTALVPITYASNNYQFLQNGIYDYNLGDNTLVRIKYQLLKTFAVWCNVDLQPLVCEINKLADQVATGNCNDVAAAQNKLNLITPKFMLVIIGITQPLTGVDVPNLIEQIKEIGGFDCDCCGVSTGIIPQTASILDGYTFDVVHQGGDIYGDVQVTGTNIQIRLHDVTYIVKVNQDSPSIVSAFSFLPTVSGDGYTKTYALSIDGYQLGLDVLNNIANNGYLLNYLNSLINQNNGNQTLIVDGKCIFTNGNSFSYSWQLPEIPPDTTYAIITGIKNGNTNIPLNYSFNVTNLSGLQSYLNGLGIGNFVVTDSGGNEIIIASTSNINTLSKLSYSSIGDNFIASQLTQAVGFVPISANKVVQNIIDAFCDLDDTQVKTSENYEICYIDPTDSTKKIVNIAGGSTLNTFISALLSNGCKTIDYVVSLSSVNCNNIKSLFQNNINLIQANDYALATKGGNCARWYPTEIGTRIFELGVYDRDFMIAFCNAVSLCNGGNICENYTVFNIDVVEPSPTDNTISLVVTFTHPSAISNILRYARVDNTGTPIYTTITGVLPGDSPYTISGLDDGQYTVGLTPIYADGRKCNEVKKTTAICGSMTSLSAVLNEDGNILINYTATSNIFYVRINISQPNGGFNSTIYAIGDSPIIVIPPSELYGDYVISATAICNIETGFEGQPTAPVIVNIATPFGYVIASNLATINTIVTSITGINGFLLNGNLNIGGIQNGIHYAFNNQTLTFVLTGAAGCGSGELIFRVNGTDVANIDTSAGAGTYTLPNMTVGANDLIEILLTNNC